MGRIRTYISDLLRKQNRKLYARSKALSRQNINEFLQYCIKQTRMPDGKILNVGAGGEIQKAVLDAIAGSQTTVTSIDLDVRRAPALVCDVCDLPFSTGTFDIVVCAEVLEHVERPQKAIDEMRRVLKNGAHLILTTRFVFPLHDRPADYFRYTRYGLALLLKQFSSIDITEQHNWGQTMAVLLVRLLLEEKRWVLLFSWPIYITARILFAASSFVCRHLGTDSMTSGYLVVATR
jgi:SAM-dependent methyltransferase